VYGSCNDGVDVPIPRGGMRSAGAALRTRPRPPAAPAAEEGAMNDTTGYELFRLAEQSLEDGHPRHAISTLERMEPDDLASPASQRLLALACYRFAALGRAREIAELVEADPSDAEAAHLLGRTLTRMGQPDAARQWLRLAAVLDPRDEHVAYADDAVRLAG
jgi:thioredoxin-like negative regulator of GroEL